MSVGRDPVDRVLDLVVVAPICVAIVARDAVPLVGSVAKRLVHDVAAQVGRQVRSPAAAGSETTITTAGAVHGENATAGVASTPADIETDELAGDGDPAADQLLALDDYDHLAARQVVDRLASLTPDELDAIDTYERAHRHRRTVLGKIEQLRP